jgi:hypothetical protein
MATAAHGRIISERSLITQKRPGVITSAPRRLGLCAGAIARSEHPLAGDARAEKAQEVGRD